MTFAWESHYKTPKHLLVPLHSSKNFFKLIKTFCLRRDLFSGLPRWLSGKESPCQYKRCEFDPWGWEDSLEKEMATHSSILAWEIPWTEESGGLQFMGL